ncbi:NAD(P)-binding domain-containing protein [Paenibacillus eucommiae]|uniref:3-hydroxyisobutyrate dehydrogenase-like beta-hydroxyacid dehydrogenase n=1 Tax=Paenibacillus eucommiae TaxID=1355755 RepID=A0ABS4J249_9BACL|nr:NAD(P)-binding domain-containing protein [Paenibacillus eucommiae]MBP1993897.1 3-hydroxyisobutyrate dehydrogenase-like beta-hydroxyacid dehydrogenase [Paenibacillus eucommiae]
MKRIGFIGIGTMGKPMAANLLSNGYSVIVYNRTVERAEELAQLGAEVVLTPADAARNSDVLFTMVSNDDALLDIFYKEQGVLEGVHPGLTVIDCSTVSPKTSKRLFEELASHLVDFLDAPVTGSTPAAEAGTLTFMIGGRKEAFEEQIDLFHVLGSKALFLGASGSGSYAKIAHNTMVGINAVGLAEGLSLATKAGIDPASFLEIVKAGGANSKQAELKGDKIIDRDFSNQFSLKLMLKDMLLASDLSGQMGVPAPLLHAATGMFQIGMSKGLGEEDLCAVIVCYESWMQQQAIRRPDASTASSMYLSDKPDGPAAARNRRRDTRVQLNIKLQLSIYQWEQEGSFSGQNIDGTLIDLSESGLQITSEFPLAPDMFIVIHFPQDAKLPPITSKVIRIKSSGGLFHYGCLLSGIPPYVQIKLEQYIDDHIDHSNQHSLQG